MDQETKKIMDNLVEKKKLDQIKGIAQSLKEKH